MFTTLSIKGVWVFIIFVFYFIFIFIFVFSGSLGVHHLCVQEECLESVAGQVEEPLQLLGQEFVQEHVQ